MTTRMLIDARHREETRVAVVKGNRIEEFDFESAERKQLKGNIYLAKVTRVEPSLQAAFIDYGGNRHGFLAFSEIHPDYYQIPKEDREALLAKRPSTPPRKPRCAPTPRPLSRRRRGRGRVAEDRTSPTKATMTTTAGEDGDDGDRDDGDSEARRSEDGSRPPPSRSRRQPDEAAVERCASAA